MPDLDVSDILFDSDFCENITITRIAQTIDNKGRAVQAPSTLNIIAVVTIGAMGANERAQDYELAKNTITVHSQTPLRGIVNGGQADIVNWQGNKWIVKRSNNWSQYGQGFTAAECVLQDTTEATI